MKKQWRFLKKEKQSATAATTQPLLTGTSSLRYYQNIYETPLSAFESCLINNNLSALIVSGYPTPQELSKAWENIMQEYSEALGEAEYQMYVNLYKEVEVLRLTYEMIHILIAALRKNESPYFCNELNTFLRTSFKFDITNTKTYFEELDKCERRAKASKIKLDLKKIEFEAIKKKIDGGEKAAIEKNYFTWVLIILSKHNQYRVTKDIFVNEYCEYVRQFNKYCDEMSQQAKK